MMPLSEELLNKLQYALEGTCRSLSEVIDAEELDIEMSDLEDNLLDGEHPIELCGDCGWWFSVGCLEFDEQRQRACCADCAPELFE